MQEFDFRIQEDDKDWEQTKIVTLEFLNWKDVATHARKLNQEHGKQVRVNYTGSLQGSYFLPQ